MEKEAFTAKMQEVGRLLGLTAVETENSHINLKGPGEKQLYLRNGGYGNDKRISIGCGYPRDYAGGINSRREDNITITVSEDKTAAQITRDIEHRLLPTYLPVLEKVIESNAKALETHTAKIAMLQVLAASIPVAYDQEEQNRTQREYRLGVYNALPGLDRVEVGYKEQVLMHIEVTLAMALAIIDLLKSTKEKED